MHGWLIRERTEHDVDQGTQQRYQFTKLVKSKDIEAFLTTFE